MPPPVASERDDHADARTMPAASTGDQSRRTISWIDLSPSLAGVFGFAVTLYLFYPGFMNWDSAWQFEQAVTEDVNNAHPPIMMHLWALTNRVLYGPAGMLAMQSAGYWGGLVLTAHYAVRGGGR